jgi:hypothetical protein
VSVRLFGHYVSVPLLVLMLAEAAIHIGAVYLGGTLRYLDVNFHIYSASGALRHSHELLYCLLLGVLTPFGLYGSALQRKDCEYHVCFSRASGQLWDGHLRHRKLPGAVWP